MHVKIENGPPTFLNTEVKFTLGEEFDEFPSDERKGVRVSGLLHTINSLYKCSKTDSMGSLFNSIYHFCDGHWLIAQGNNCTCNITKTIQQQQKKLKTNTEQNLDTQQIFIMISKGLDTTDRRTKHYIRSNSYFPFHIKDRIPYWTTNQRFTQILHI